MKKRRNRCAKFNACVALETVKAERMVPELAAAHYAHSTTTVRQCISFFKGVHLILALLASVGPIQAQDMYSLWGVWVGRIGGIDVRFCAQSEPGNPFSDNFAAVYTTKDYNIQLLDRQSSTTWTSRLAQEETISVIVLGDAFVHLEGPSSEIWSGVTLRAVEWADDVRPCVSDAFNAPRAFLPAFSRTPAEMDGASYEVVSIIDPSGVGVITTFRLPVTSDGIEALNARLAEALPDTIDEALYYACALDALQIGAGSFWEHWIRPEWITDRFIVVEEEKNFFCGGANPNHSVEWYIINLETGEEIDTSAWIRGDAFYTLGPHAGQRPEVGDDRVANAFRELMLEAFYATDPVHTCNDLLDIVETWNVRPNRTGLLLAPSGDLGPQRACATELFFPFEAVMPYLAEIDLLRDFFLNFD